ncbi:MAG: LamG domain-containing protein [Alphaproteobacteria bacterium]|nr:LamG domain-containing protein [Alphaproteobacteria bacterium]MDE2110349.1 LamG domain-containing protein [Alphaproteobacteria bacterium]MDE2494888.1 LamG domain-containing protein [Alphaproteobacteria bacterium]
MTRNLFSAFAVGMLAIVAGSASAKPHQIVWKFDRLHNIGGAATHVEGHPQIVSTAAGKAVVFNGVDDALFIDRHPLAGAKTFTEEAIIRPDGGAFEQRWMHLAETDPATGKDSGTRFLFEIRVVGRRWYLDAFVKGPGYSHTLAEPEKTFPIGRWYAVAQTYDGRMYRSYVNGQLQAEAPIDFQPQGPGHASVGVRINHVNYFHGAILEARFTPRALTPEVFLKVSANLNAGQKP